MSTPQPTPSAEGWKDPYRRPKRPFAWLKTVFLLLLLYILTTGPLCRLADKHTISWELVHRIYAPLIWAANFPPLDFCLDWYIQSVWKVKSNRLNAPANQSIPPALSSVAADARRIAASPISTA